MAAQVTPFRRERRFLVVASDSDHPPVPDHDDTAGGVREAEQNSSDLPPVRVEYPRLHTESTGARPGPDPTKSKRARAAGARGRSG